MQELPLFVRARNHGIIKIACCVVWAGASIEAFPKFMMETTLGRVATGAYSVFMAVPTI